MRPERKPHVPARRPGRKRRPALKPVEVAAPTAAPQWFRTMLKQLRESVPPILPVRVYIRESLADAHGGILWGQATLRMKGGQPSHFVVEVRAAEEVVMRDTLLHEWAHCRAWHEGPFDTEEHPDEWGIQLAKAYRATR